MGKSKPRSGKAGRGGDDASRESRTVVVHGSLVPRPSPSSAPCALRVIIKCGRGKTASVFPPPHLIITRNAHGAEEGEGLGTRLVHGMQDSTSRAPLGAGVARYLLDIRLF